MPRPHKPRKVCQMPLYKGFAPIRQDPMKKDETVILTVDEFETIRLIDYEKMTQEECARQMGIARSTVQNIYDSSRHKLAVMLVTGADMNISGGSFSLCEERRQGKPCGRCRGYHHEDKEIQ